MGFTQEKKKDKKGSSEIQKKNNNKKLDIMLHLKRSKGIILHLSSFSFKNITSVF